MSECLVLRQLGDATGFVLKSEVISITSATDQEAIIYIGLRNGSRIEHWASYDEQFTDELLRLIADMGWSD